MNTAAASRSHEGSLDPSSSSFFMLAAAAEAREGVPSFSLIYCISRLAAGRGKEGSPLDAFSLSSPCSLPPPLLSPSSLGLLDQPSLWLGLFRFRGLFPTSLERKVRACLFRQKRNPLPADLPLLFNERRGEGGGTSKAGRRGVKWRGGRD